MSSTFTLIACHQIRRGGGGKEGREGGEGRGEGKGRERQREKRREVFAKDIVHT